MSLSVVFKPAVWMERERGEEISNARLISFSVVLSYESLEDINQIFTRPFVGEIRYGLKATVC